MLAITPVTWGTRTLPEILARMTLVEQLRARKKALTVEELADLLGVAARTLYKEVEDGHVPFFRVRTSIRFDGHQVAEWLEAKMPSQSIRTRRQKETAAGA
jgi:excisionase family DNA binding protein